MPDVDRELKELRARIDSLDDRLVDLLAERRRLVEEVAEIKKRHQLPAYHPAREEDLISQRRRAAAARGLAPDFVEEIFRQIMRHSRATQNRSLAARAVRPGATVLLVGGAGEMGAYFRRWFTQSGYQVRILERDDWERAAELCRGIDLALVGVPIDVTGEAIARLGPHLDPEVVLADITSVKEMPLRAMLAAHAGPVLGLHPLFGASTSTLDKQIVVVTPGRQEEKCRWVIEQFQAWGAVTVQAGAAEHDRIMAIVQALRHFATFAFGRFLCRQGVDLQRTLEFSSPIYRLELGMVGRLFAQDPGLYGEIIFADRQRTAMLLAYLDSLAELRQMLAAPDKQAFHREFAAVADWFGPFGDQALRESSFLIDKLIERF
ncbi:MAG: bifunctional chorismate mutase/prephenate dehydrogenase [Deltaproteobacteria bacterium]|nr:bifunctional chorismate mutase/prephenate dehydrogenase [Deltaproteobacteria bacterium]